MVDFIKKHKILFSVLLFVLVFLMIVISAVKDRNAKKASSQVEQDTSIIDGSSTQEGSDSVLLQQQQGLIEQFGPLPDGCYYDTDGTILGKGDTNLSPEEVIEKYMQAIKTLDIATVQKFTRGSTVVDTYSGYFDVTNKGEYDYYDSFIKNMYKQCMLSLQNEGVANSSVFADNKVVITVKATMLDLTQKDFWIKDKAEIYKNLQLYGTDEGDSAKSEIYLYDYISSYYASENAVRREVTFDLTLQKYTDLNTGWLISIDSDVDAAFKYSDGLLVVDYIRTDFQDNGSDYLDRLKSKESKNN